MKQLSRKSWFGIVAATAVVAYPVSARAQFDTAAIDWAIQELCGHINGHLGGLLVTVAAFGALVAAAFGTFRVFHGAIITAVGAFAIVNIMSLYFDEASKVCEEGTGGGGGAGAPRVVTPNRTAVDLSASNPNLELEKNVIAAAPPEEEDTDPALRVVD